MLLDFDAARRSPENDMDELTSLVTRGYSPYEQYDIGLDSPQGPWSDIYACAGLMYRCVTEKLPAGALTRSISELGGHGDVYEPAYDADSTAQLLVGIDSALALDPRHRPQSVNRVAGTAARRARHR